MKNFFAAFLTLSFLLLTSEKNFAQQGEWTWVHGCNNVGCSAVWGTQGVPDPANTPESVYAPYYWVDAQKNLWVFGGISNGYYSAMWKYDPTANEWTWMSGSNSSFSKMRAGNKERSWRSGSRSSSVV